MKITREEIMRQQQVLKHLGYYGGDIDGIWSFKSATAKLRFERSGKFNPAIPNNGNPFVVGAKLPEGLIYVDGKIAVPGVVFDTPEPFDLSGIAAKGGISIGSAPVQSAQSTVYDPRAGGHVLSRKDRKRMMREMKVSEIDRTPEGSPVETSTVIKLPDPEDLQMTVG